MPQSPHPKDSLRAEEKPFLVKKIVRRVKVYNPNYGDNRMCTCGHVYYRHFDSYDDMANVGCKYQGWCGCNGFEEQK